MIEIFSNETLNNIQLSIKYEFWGHPLLFLYVLGFHGLFLLVFFLISAVSVLNFAQII